MSQYLRYRNALSSFAGSNLLLSALLLAASACESDPGIQSGRNTTPDDSETGSVDGDADDDNDRGDDTDDGDPIDWGGDSEDCDSLLEITVRDFDETHPDMQRTHPGWGPLAGVLEPELDANRKPVFSSINGTHTWKTGLEGGVLEKNCWDSGPGTPEQCYNDDANPMFDGPESFHDWYHDTEKNLRFEKQLQMEETVPGSGVFVYDSNDFFPLSPSEGFGITPTSDNPMGQNYLFTTEIHLKFQYVKGQKFTFRGDDDLWVFVNNRIALDIGGMHLPFEGTIDFDAKADELGITPDGLYHMDIFHAERRTTGSNFRIETNIKCFIPITID